MFEINLKYILKQFIFFILIVALIVFINTIRIHLNFSREGLTNSSVIDTSIISNKNDAFCEHHRGSSHILEQSCGKLTQGNCNSTSCCVWTSNNKCVAGNANGATFNTDKNGKTNALDYYYYKNKCYGPKC